jgi:GNAT superfamily N-acetyltransferase
MSNPIFRLIKAHELDALLELYTFLHEKDDPLPPRDELLNIWTLIMDNPANNYFVIELDGIIVSSCVLTIISNLTRGCRPYGLIENVVTREEYRKRGLGTIMLQRVLDFSWAKGCYKVMLLTGRKDAATLRFYEGAGLKKGIKTGFIALPPVSE